MTECYVPHTGANRRWAIATVERVLPVVLAFLAPIEILHRSCAVARSPWLFIGLAVAALASPGIPFSGLPRPRVARLAGLSYQRAFTLIEGLICAAVVAFVVVGVVQVFGHSHQEQTTEANAQGLQDVGATIGIDAQAIGAYDPNAQAHYEALGQQQSTMTVNGQPTTVNVAGTTLGMSVHISSPDGTSANLVAPFAQPKATPE